MINFSKKYPNYFNKYILKGSFIVCLIIIVIAISLNGFSPYEVYIKCNQTYGCKNPLINCQEEINFPKAIGNYSTARTCSKSSVCSIKPEYCLNETMKDGEVFGKENNYLSKVNPICYLIIMIGFIVNHIWWLYGKRNKNRS
jgi:hypothetical protein